MVFHWRLSDSKSQVSRTLLSILAVFNNAVVSMVSTRPPTSKSSRPFNNPLVNVLLLLLLFYIYFWGNIRFCTSKIKIKVICICISLVVIFQAVVLIFIVISWNTMFRPLYPPTFLFFITVILFSEKRQVYPRSQTVIGVFSSSCWIYDLGLAQNPTFFAIFCAKLERIVNLDFKPERTSLKF